MSSSINPQNNRDIIKYLAPLVQIWWTWLERLMRYRADKLNMGLILIWSLIWPWRSRSTTLQNNKDLNQGLLHLSFKFGDPNLNGWWVIPRTNMVTDGRTDGRTDAGNDTTWMPILASGIERGSIKHRKFRAMTRIVLTLKPLVY